MPDRKRTKSTHGGPGRNQGRPTNEDRGLAPALEWFGAKAPPKVLAAMRTEAARRGVAFNRVVCEWLERAKAQR